MKKSFLLLATLVVMLLTSLTACVGCKEGDPEKEGISFDTFLVEGTSVYVVVSNTTTEFSFEEEITTKGDTDYVLSLDANRMQPLESKTVQLGVGNNLFYVTELIGGETTNTYYVTIRRRPVYNVTFVATDDETIVENQMVEEDSFAKEPSAVTVIGCDFLAWDYDFTTPITQDVKINAKLKVKQEMSNFIFSANETFCQIKGVIDKTVTEVTIPDYVTDISASAFYKCRNLISVIIGNGVMSIGRNAFYSCRSLTTITIPNGVVTIGENAFYECYNLASITIPSTVVAIGEKAFEACYKLVEVVNKSPHVAVTKGGTDNGGIGLYALAVYNSGDTFVSQLSNDDGYLVYADGQEKILIGYVGKETNLILPTYITQIYKYAFSFNGDLTNVTVPNGTTAIGERAFV